MSASTPSSELEGNKPTAADVNGREPTPAELMRQYVSGIENPFIGTLRKSLEQAIDPLTQEFGADYYEVMLRDSDVQSAIDAIRLSVMSDGLRVETALKPPEEFEDADTEVVAKATTAQEYKEFIERRLEAMDVPLSDLCYEMLEGIALGNKVAEKVACRIVTGQDGGKIGWQTVKTLYRRNFAFVVDAWGNTLGLITVQPDKFLLTVPYVTFLGNPDQYPTFMPKEKFMIFTHDPRGGDPRGRSVIRSASNPYQLKTSSIYEYAKYLSRFGSGFIFGTPAPGIGGTVNDVDQYGNIIKNPDGTNKQVTKEQAMLNSLQGLANGSVSVNPPGSTVNVVIPTGSGEPFLNAMDYFGKQIHQSILKTARATKEAQHGSKADSGVAQDVMDLYVYNLKIKLGKLITESLVKPLILINFGPEALDLCPTVELVATPKQDLPAMVTAYAAAGYALDETQFPYIDVSLGIKARDLEAIAKRKAEEQDQLNSQNQMMASMYAPGSQPKPNKNAAADGKLANQDEEEEDDS